MQRKFHQECSKTEPDFNVIKPFFDEQKDIKLKNLFAICKNQTAGFKIAELMLEKKPEWVLRAWEEEKQTFLHFCCKPPYMNLKILKTFLQHGFDPNLQTISGKSVFYLFCENIQNPDIDIFRLFFEQGANPNLSCSEKETPFSLISSKDLPDLGVIELFFQNKADPNQKTHSSETLFFKLCSKKKTNESLIKLFLKYKANPNIPNKIGYTALHIVAIKNTYLQRLETLLRADANPDIQDNEGNTPLHLSCSKHNCNADIIGTLLKYKANPDILNYAQANCFDLLCEKFQHNINAVKKMISCDAVKLESLGYLRFHLDFLSQKKEFALGALIILNLNEQELNTLNLHSYQNSYIFNKLAHCILKYGNSVREYMTEKLKKKITVYEVIQKQYLPPQKQQEIFTLLCFLHRKRKTDKTFPNLGKGVILKIIADVLNEFLTNRYLHNNEAIEIIQKVDKNFRF